jgi:hypothetical protein
MAKEAVAPKLVGFRNGVPAVRQPQIVELMAAPKLAAAAAGTFGGFTYHGGPIIRRPQVIASFWGALWADAAHQARAQRLDQYLQDLLASPFMNMLSQYGVGSGAGNAGTFLKATFLSPVPAVLTDAQIHGIIQSEINSGLIPQPGGNSALLIFLDENTGVQDSSVVMCEPLHDTAFGYHFFFTTSAGAKCYYGVIPALSDACLHESCPSDPNCSLHLAQTQEQRQTQVTSHEFAEMTSDPELNAWTDPANGENGDICNGEPATITVGPRTWTVQRIYSKFDDIVSQGATVCVATEPAPKPDMVPVFARKVTLGDTALGAPALALTPAGTAIALAWTGTDAAHHLNVMTSPNGQNFGGKVTLGDTSIDGPAIASGNGRLFLAWTGTDANHHLNVMSSTDLHNFGNKVTLGDTSGSGPALAFGNGRLFLAWTGRDAHRSLNVMSSTDGKTFTNKVTLNDNSFSSPGLAFIGGKLYLLWEGTDANRSLNIMESSDGITFTNKVTLGDSSNQHPALIEIAGLFYLAWTGRDPQGHLNTLSSPVNVNNFGNKVTDGDSSVASPALVLLQGQVLIGWTGTDAQHHLNVAALV